MLGGILISTKPDTFRRISALLTVDDFFLPANRHVFAAMVELDRRRRPVEITGLADELRATGMLPRLEGGEGYLVTLANSIPTMENLGHYVRIVREKAGLRRVIRACGEWTARAYGETDHDTFMAEVRQAAIAATSGSTGRRRVDWREGGDAVLEGIEQRAREPGKQSIMTGLTEFDRLTGGLRPGNVIVIAAGTSIGKTALAMNFGCTAAVKHGLPVLVFSREMTWAEIYERCLAHVGRIEGERIRSGEISMEEWRDRLWPAHQKLSESKGATDERSQTIAEIESEARDFRAQHHDSPLGMIVIDYLQLVRGVAKKQRQDTREREVAEVAGRVKDLAKELKWPIVELSQLNRGPEKDDRKPSLGDLRESGSVEQAADIVAFVHRDRTVSNGLAEIIVEKDRGGSIGTVEVAWRGDIMTFENPNRDSYQEDRRYKDD